MTEAERKRRENCPFWSSASVKCSICNGGLFIPLDDHREAFCKTPRFSSCQQYLFHTEKQIHLREMVRNSGENRRKYVRVGCSHTITLLEIFRSGKLVSSFTSGFKTFDLSQGGMRLETEKPLTSDATVQFCLDDSFPPALRRLTGLVEWCNKQVNEPGYQVGVSFQGKHITEALDRYLGQLSQNM